MTEQRQYPKPHFFLEIRNTKTGERINILCSHEDYTKFTAFLRAYLPATTDPGLREYLDGGE